MCVCIPAVCQVQRSNESCWYRACTWLAEVVIVGAQVRSIQGHDSRVSSNCYDSLFQLLMAYPAPSYRPYSHKLLTINNYVNCPLNFAFARSIYLFHPPIFENILMRIRSIGFKVKLSKHVSDLFCRGCDKNSTTHGKHLRALAQEPNVYQPFVLGQP